MRHAVVDASAIVSALTNVGGPSLVPFLSDARLHAPQLIDLEVASALRRLERKHLSTREARSALDAFTSLMLTRYEHPPLVDRIWSLRQNLSSYDAAYVVLAEALEIPLITCDKGLARAAGQYVEVLGV